MLNETFMFFWLVSLAENVTGFLVMFAAICLIAIIPMGAIAVDAYDKERTMWMKYIKRCVAMAIVSAVVGVSIPPPAAFYGGATQYVAEVGEVSDTLLKLKDALDAKLVDLAEED